MTERNVLAGLLRFHHMKYIKTHKESIQKKFQFIRVEDFAQGDR